MNIFDDITSEHNLFEKAAGSLVTAVQEWTETESSETRQDIINLCSFFIMYMVNIHTQKEEKVIFNALEKLHLPRDKGPIYYYELEHKEHLIQAREILKLLEKTTLSEEEKIEINAKAGKYCGEIWEHIDKENSVLIDEVIQRVRGQALLDMNKAYENFLQEHKPLESLINLADEIIKKYKPVIKLPHFIRGDGCMSCRHFGEGCSGIEHEWWTEHEWEDFFERNNRD